jgi:electron-transferring-flavoprotein dehydrogenase
MPEIQREILELDILIVGGGPAGLGCAIRLAQKMKADGTPYSVALIEKGSRLGAHSLSGAVVDPRALRELLPDHLKDGFPLESPVTGEALYFLTESLALPSPVIPKNFDNHGNYIVALGKMTKWLGEQLEKIGGVDIFTEFSGYTPLYETNRVTGEKTLVGIRLGDKGIDKHGMHKANFEPGTDIKAKVVILAEGVRGSLAKQVIRDLKLDEDSNPQSYSLGIKEVWEVEAKKHRKGQVVHTAGFPLDLNTYGGSWIYHMDERLVSIGLVVSLDYSDPLLDPHAEFNRFKEHPYVKNLLTGGKMVKYGAKAIPLGGWFSVPRPCFPGGLLAGDTAGFVNAPRLKGIHLAMKSGMLAADTALYAVQAGRNDALMMGKYWQDVKASWIWDELYPVRNFHQAFEHGMVLGSLRAGAQMLLNGRDPLAGERLHGRASFDLSMMLDHQGKPGSVPDRYDRTVDDTLTFAKVKDVFHSGTMHDEDQPAHLKVSNTDICRVQCAEEYGNPCTKFCPASVYEMIPVTGAAPGAPLKLQINFANCVHCKTCDIKDPYQIIDWTPPKAGDGPAYDIL